MKKILAILLCICFLPLTGLAAEKVSNFQVTGAPMEFSYSLDCEEEYLVLFFTAEKESGRKTLYSDNGHFEGSCPLQCTSDESKVKVRIENLKKQKLAEQSVITETVNVEVSKVKQDENVKKARKITDLVCEPILGGARYQFTALGHDQVILKYKSSQQKGEMVLYAGENYTYSGELPMIYTYPQSNVFLEIYTIKGGNLMAKGQTTRGYVLEAKETEPSEGRLNGVTVCIDAGHQNIHKNKTEPLGPGLNGKVTSKGGMAQGKTTRRKESMVVLEVAYLLRDELLRQGANVVMTREVEDTWLSNIERCDIAEEGNADFMLRLHCDTRDNPNARGISIYCPLRSDYAKAAAPYEEYKALAEALLAGMKNAAGYELKESTGRTTFNDKYVGNNWAKMPCFLVEMGFMSNPAEDVKMADPHYQQVLAEGMTQGIYDMAVLRGLVK